MLLSELLGMRRRRVRLWCLMPSLGLVALAFRQPPPVLVTLVNRALGSLDFIPKTNNYA